MAIDSRTPLPAEITRLITSKAQQLVGHYRFTESDRGEIEQAVALDVIRKRSAVDPTRAYEMGFLICLVEHAVADIIAARTARGRDYRLESGSLDRWVKDDLGDWARASDLVTEDNAGQRVGRPGMSQEDLRDLAIDLAGAAANLSARLRVILEHYTVLGSAREVAKATGLHHSSVCDALKQIKRHFEEAGLQDYLPKPRTNPTDRSTRR